MRYLIPFLAGASALLAASAWLLVLAGPTRYAVLAALVFTRLALAGFLSNGRR